MLVRKTKLTKQVPLTFRTAEWLLQPAGFLATQVYSPACSCETESMFKVLTFRAFNTETPCLFVMVSLLCNHSMSMGISPRWTVQVSDAVSPELTASSPKSKGRIWGSAVDGDKGREGQNMHVDNKN